MKAAPTLCVAPKKNKIQKNPKHWESAKKRGPSGASYHKNELHPFLQNQNLPRNRILLPSNLG